jgi:hypothetical protein
VIEGIAGLRGSGLFAARSYRKGEVVARFPQVFVAEPAAHTVQVDDRVHLDTSGDPTRLLNHACEPSCVVDPVSYEVVALVELSAGDEFTFDYLTTEWELAAPFPCRCGSEACVGEVRGYRFATDAERSARSGRVLPYLARKAMNGGA